MSVDFIPSFASSAASEASSVLSRSYIKQQLQYVVDEACALSARSSVRCLWQVFAVKKNQSNETVLSTKGWPFGVSEVSGAGSLQLFRTISETFKFGTNVANPDKLGCVGVAYVSQQSQAILAISSARSRVFHRRNHAQRLRIASAMMFPIFSPGKTAPVGVLEVVFDAKPEHPGMFLNIAQKALEAHNFATKPLAERAVDLSQYTSCAKILANSKALQLEKLASIHEDAEFVCAKPSRGNQDDVHISEYHSAGVFMPTSLSEKLTIKSLQDLANSKVEMLCAEDWHPARRSVSFLRLDD